MKSQWQNRTMHIIDEISMVFLKLLSTVDSQLSQAKRKKDNDIVRLGGLAVVSIMKDFNQFPPVVRKSLWVKAITSAENHGERI